MSEWKMVPLGELYGFRSGLSKPRSAFGSGYGFLSFKDVFYNYFVPEDLTELVNSTEHEREACSIHRGDVFLTRTSETMDELGMSCVALKNYPNATFNGFTKRLRPKQDARIVPEYAGYYFRSPAFRRDVTSMSSMSTRASLNNDMLERLSMLLPDVYEQERIGRILKSLDDKIKLNRRMNRTLEAIARAIFKSWFIDFDPVHAKAEGREPVGMDAETAALFPDSFQDSPLGKIPKDWVAQTLGEICEKPQYGYTQSSSEEQVGPRFLRIKDINKQPWIEWSSVPYCEIDESNYKKYKLQVGDIVIARIADPGHGALISADVDAVFASYLIRFRLLDKRYSRYFQYWLRSPGYWALVRARRSGSTRGNLNAKVLSRFPIVVPNADLVEKFQLTIEPLARESSTLVKESEILSATRDTLHPGLISGDVAVSGAKESGVK